MEALDTIIKIDKDTAKVERLIADYVHKNRRPADIQKIKELVLDNYFITDYDFRFALSRLLASRELTLDDNRRLILNK